jgi:hypothetical protein
MAEEHPKSFNDLRDIRKDLRERISLIQQAIDKDTRDFEAKQKQLLDAFQTRVQDAKVALAGYVRLLEIEERRAQSMLPAAVAGTAPPPPTHTPKSPLADFLCSAMAQTGVKTKEELRDLAQGAGYFGAGEGGRTIHATIVNLVRGGRVRELPDGKYAVRLPVEGQRDLLERRV